MLPKSCGGCVLETNPRCGVFTKVVGEGRDRVLIVGESSGLHEATSGLPIAETGAAGAVFEKILRQLGKTRKDVIITNVLRCQTPNGLVEKMPWEHAALEKCRENLQKVVEEYKPKVVIALGPVALRELTGFSGGKKALRYVRGYALDSWVGVPVVPTFHPKFIGEGQGKLLGLVIRDFILAFGIARGSVVPILDIKEAPLKYEVGIQALERLYERAKADETLPIAFDLETSASAFEDEDEVLEYTRDEQSEDDEDENESRAEEAEEVFGREALNIQKAEIKTIQFSLGIGEGVSVNWGKRCAELTQALMELPNLKIGHNAWLFDCRILARHGIRIKGPVDDTLWMYHHMQPDLPGHLQAVAGLFGMPAPWKHLAGVEQMFYGSADVDAVQRIIARLPQDLKNLGLWDAYVEFVRNFQPLLRDMERRGIPVSVERLGEFRNWIKAEVDRMNADLQAAVPDEFRVLKKKEPFKGIPNEVKRWLKERHPEVVGAKKSKQTQALKEVKWDDPWFQQALKDTGFHVRDGKIWKSELKDFNPGSSSQLLGYIKEKGYPIPRKFKDGKPTTGDRELERLVLKTKDPVLDLARNIRAVSKMGNAYAGKEGEDGKITGGWMPNEDGRLRATFTFGPATGQLAARNPNVLTTPKRRKDLAKRFRQCIVARPGYVLIEFDYRAFHARTTGLEARDATYMRLSDLDIHSYVAGHLVKWKGIETALDLSDADLKGFLKEIKAKHEAVRNFKAKPSILGIGFGMGSRRLYFENRDSFESEGEARRLLDLIRSLFPNVFQWQEDICELAAEQHRLVSKWGAVRWLWDVFAWKKEGGRWVRRGGRDAEKAKAFLPANDAHYMLRFKLLKMEEWGWLDRFGLINVIHDAVLFECPVGMVDECVQLVGNWLQEPVAVLADEVVAPGGFFCAAEASVGNDWSQMKEMAI